MIDEIVKGGLCYGCGLCKTLCPAGAIKMIPNNLGFKEPNIDVNACISCGKCIKNCVAANPPKMNEPIEQFGTKALDKDVIENSSSGGMFTVLSDWILKKNGVVWGCILSGNEAKITSAEDKSGRDKMCGSKYVQSDMTDCLPKLAQQLQQGRFVMFSGTPCQCGAVQCFVREQHINDEHLYIMDIICHGSPSPRVFCEYIMWLESKYNSKIKGFHFRPRIIEATNQLAFAEFENGMKYLMPSSVDLFYNAFHDDFIHKESCYKCGFTKTARVSDIMVGDLSDSKYRGKGFSQVYINTDKGRLWFEEVRRELDVFLYESAEKLQPQLKHPVEMPQHKIETREKLKESSFPFESDSIRKVNAIIMIERMLCRLHLFDFAIKIINVLKTKK